MTAVRVFVAALIAASQTAAVGAQTLIAPVEHLAFDRPESWALQYFTSATLSTWVIPTLPERPGSIAIELEGGWLPALSPVQEQVGFAGTAAEDLNKAPIFVRPGVRIAAARNLALTVSGVPPVRAFGVTPRLIDVGVDWAVLERRAWRFMARADGQAGSVTGAFTCPNNVLAYAPGSAGNPTGCTAASADAATLRYGSVDVAVARAMGRDGRFVPHVAFGVNAIDGIFQVDARTFGNIDRTRLETSGATWSASAGATARLGERVDGGIELLYTPLTVRRIATGPETTDALFTVRGVITYRARR